MSNIELGDKVKCKITGFSGIATAIAKCLTGCDRVEIKPDSVNKDGTLKDGYWFDLNAVAIVKKQAIKPKSVQDPRPDKKGGPPTKSNL